MTTKTKTYVALVALALAALVIDRCFLGATAPQTTLAFEDDAAPDESTDAPPSRPQRPVVPRPNPGKLTAPELHFPRHLPVFEPASQIRDIFTRADDDPRASSPKSSRPRVPDPGSRSPILGRHDFMKAHRIDAVMTQDRLKIALVEGRWLRPGDILDHCTLTRIEGDAATFQCPDGEAILSPSRKRTPPPD